MVAAAVASDLAPMGRIRVGINHGNPVLAKRDASGELSGVAVDLARELGRRTNLPVELVPFDAAGKMVAALASGAWDVAFLAVEPGRGGAIGFTAPYLEIEGAYLVPARSPLGSVDEVDREGVRVALAAGSAYDLFLSRTLRRARLIRAPSPSAAFELLRSGQAEVLAGVKQTLLADSKRLPGSRVLPGRFMAIHQAVGIPKSREAGLAYLREFIEEMKASGFVAQAIARAGLEGVAVAPATPGEPK